MTPTSQTIRLLAAEPGVSIDILVIQIHMKLTTAERQLLTRPHALRILSRRVKERKGNDGRTLQKRGNLFTRQTSISGQG